jgi:hypothetical protein
MTDLTLYGRRVETVFELLGEAEDDITYSVGWGLAQSEDFARALLAEVYGANVSVGELTAVRLQEIDKETGRTDVEVESEWLHLIVNGRGVLPSAREVGRRLIAVLANEHVDDAETDAAG